MKKPTNSIIKLFLRPSILLIPLLFLVYILIKYDSQSDLQIPMPSESELFEGKADMPENHKRFILELIPLIQQVNQNVLEEREKLKAIILTIELKQPLKSSDKKFLSKLATHYLGKNEEEIKFEQNFNDLKFLNELLKRVDIVPVRLALAQSAIESGWGRSRFCNEGNAYFGIHCYTNECGIKANANSDGGFEVKSYASANESVIDYVHFLNSKRGMQRFRNERIRYFHTDSIPDLLRLAGSMKGYSAIGDTYKYMIKSILDKYIPEEIANY